MAIGKRIRFIRKAKGMTAKALGQAVGFPERDADIRISQYETGSRTPKQELLKKLAASLDVSQKALDVPDIEGNEQLLHRLFALEDMFGFQICRSGSHIYMILNSISSDPELLEGLLTWCSYAEMLRSGKITRKEYDRWRYNFTADKNHRKK